MISCAFMENASFLFMWGASKNYPFAVWVDLLS